MGLGAYLAILVVFAVRCVTELRRRGREAAAPLTSCVLAVAGITVAGLFEYNWGDAEVWIPTLVCLATPFSEASG